MQIGHISFKQMRSLIFLNNQTNQLSVKQLLFEKDGQSEIPRITDPDTQHIIEFHSRYGIYRRRIIGYREQHSNDGW